MKNIILLLLGLAVTFSPLTYAESIFSMGYLELKKDPRYKKKRLFARFAGQALGRPYAGAEIAIGEVKFHGSEIDTSFKLEYREAKNNEQLSQFIDDLYSIGVHFFIIDLPAKSLAKLAKKYKDSDIALFNISAYDDFLRNTACQGNLYHTLPSHAMLMDALAQYLISKKWRNVLLLESEKPEDRLVAATFEKSAKRYGLKISDKRIFEFGNDPRQRAKNNVALITGGKKDVIFIADSEGEFARQMPYQTLNPNLIVGSEGLNASTWHWSWERYGAPQLVKRFDKKHHRPMGNTDWAAWMAVKAIAGAVQGTKSTDYKKLTAYLTSAENILDTFKGNASNFRPWNNQLRQPILLTTHNWVVERAPLKGFLHQKNNLDTLGDDQRRSQCKILP